MGVYKVAKITIYYDDGTHRRRKRRYDDVIVKDNPNDRHLMIHTSDNISVVIPFSRIITLEIEGVTTYEA